MHGVRAAGALAILAALGLAGCHSSSHHNAVPGANAPASGQPASGQAAPAALVTPEQLKATVAATTTCLTKHGATVTPVQPTDPEMQELRDLAQVSARQVEMNGALAGIAIGKSPSEAELLSELLARPDSPYRTEVHGRILVLYRSAAAPVLKPVFSCAPR